MPRTGARYGVTLAGIASLLLVTLAPAGAAQTAATPVPTNCGTPVASWGGGFANDVGVDLLAVERIDDASAATPMATPVSVVPSFFAELRAENVGNAPAAIAVAEITLVLCDEREVRPVPDLSHPPFADGELPVGASRTGWVAFALDAEDVPVRLIVPISRPGLTGGRVEFPLVSDEAGTAAAAGADAVGGDAVGEDGDDGANATAAAGESGQG